MRLRVLLTASICTLATAVALGQSKGAAPSDAYQRRMEVLRQQARERAAAEAQQRDAQSQQLDENARLRMTLETMAWTFANKGQWSGPTDAAALARLSASDIQHYAGAATRPATEPAR